MGIKLNLVKVVYIQFCNNLTVNNLNNRILNCSFVQFLAPPCICIVVSVVIGYNTETVFTTLKTTLLAPEVNPRRLLHTNHPPSGREVLLKRSSRRIAGNIDNVIRI